MNTQPSKQALPTAPPNESPRERHRREDLMRLARVAELTGEQATELVGLMYGLRGLPGQIERLMAREIATHDAPPCVFCGEVLEQSGHVCLALRCFACQASIPSGEEHDCPVQLSAEERAERVERATNEAPR